MSKPKAKEQAAPKPVDPTFESEMSPETAELLEATRARHPGKRVVVTEQGNIQISN